MTVQEEKEHHRRKGEEEYIKSLQSKLRRHGEAIHKNTKKSGKMIKIFMKFDQPD